MQRKLLIVDDDRNFRAALCEQLALHEDFVLQEAATARDGIEAVQAGAIDLVVLDVGLPDMSGVEACQQMRLHGYKGPVMMLTGQSAEADEVLGLEAGANDYVIKPFRFSALLARIKAQLRQYEASEDVQFTIGPYYFRPSAKQLSDAEGGKIRLTEKETAILKFLYRAGDKPMTRDVLLSQVWGYNSGVTTHTLETHIYRLRQKIEKDPTRSEILVTEGGGYKLVP